MKTIATSRTIAMTLLATFLVVGLSACGDRDRHQAKIDHTLDFVAYRLSFDESQKAIVDKLKLEIADARAETAESQAKIRDLQFERALELLNADSVSAEEFARELDKLFDVHKERAEEFMPKVLPLLSDLHGTLNDTQKAKLEKKLRHWQEHSLSKRV